MKNLKKISAIATFMLVSLTSMATVPTSSLVISEEGKNLFFNLVTHSNATTVTITDKTEKTIFYANVYDENYARKFNLEQLEDGTYYFAVDKHQESAVYTLNIKGDKIEITEKEEKSSSPVFKINGDKVIFTLSNQDLKKVEIKITNSNNSEVFRETVRVEGSLEKVFNFEKALKDQYTITIKDGIRTHSQHFSAG